MRIQHVILRAMLLVLGMPASAFEIDQITGSPPSPLQLQNVAGEVRSLDQFLGRVVLVNFWTSWCPPCLAEIPSLERLKRDLSNRPFEVFAVNVAEPRGTASRFGYFSETDIHLLLDSDGEEAKKWNVRFFPTSFLVDSSGQLTYRILGDADWGLEELQGRINRLLPDRPVQ